MKHNTLIRLRRTMVLGLVAAAAITTSTATAAIEPRFVNPTAGAFAASTEQFVLPPGATAEPVAASTGQFALPAGATVEPVAASTEQPGGVEAAPAYYGGVQAAPVASIPVVEVRGGLDWADAGIGAGIAFGGILLLGGALLVVRRSAQHHRLATH